MGFLAGAETTQNTWITKAHPSVGTPHKAGEPGAHSRRQTAPQVGELPFQVLSCSEFL